MVDSIIQSFDIWTSAQGMKSKGRVKSIDNISLEGISQLRKLILELAIQGRLMEQDLSDEPATQALKKVQKENEKLIKEGKLKRIKSLSEITEVEYPFALPLGWMYVRLNEVGEWGSGATPNRSNSEYYGGDIPWFKSGELVSDYIDTSEEFVTELALKESSLRYNQVGDVLLAMYGATIGKTSILNVRATTNQAVCACTPFKCIWNRYLLILLKAYKTRFAEMGTGGAQPNISRDKIIATVIALPPFEEQKRIVAKVNELMALCDELEKEHTKNFKSHQTLVKALLGTLIQAENADELQVAWQRTSTHFDTLFCTEDSIDQLKQAILQLAIMGKLVKQDPNDEPAKELVKQIVIEKRKYINLGRIKSEKPLSNVSEEEKPFKIPKHWEWVRLGSISADIHYGYTASASDQNLEVRLLRITDIQDDEVNWLMVPGCEIDNEQAARYLLEDGDILIARTGGTIGKSYLVSDISVNSVFASYLIRVKKLPSSYPEYIKIYLRSQLYWNQLYLASMGTGQPNVNGSSLKNLKLPLPPVAEQKRIVAKVNDLMAICDRLIGKIKKAQEIQKLLSKTIVDNAVA